MNATTNIHQFNQLIKVSDTATSIDDAQQAGISGGNAGPVSIITEDEGIRIVEEDGGLLIIEDYGGI